jgi:hypothetical protein
MTVTEFSNQFDLLFNNITSNQAPGLNEYEKSVFLTKAQDEIVKNYFEADSQGNTVKKGFDDTAIRQMDFSDLIMSKSFTEAQSSDKSYLEPDVDPRALVYKISKSDGVYIIINESLNLMAHQEGRSIVKGIRQVIPVKYTEYMRLMSKPFKEPLKNTAWRIISKGREGDADVDTTSGDPTLTDKNISSKIEIVTTSADRNKYRKNGERDTIVYNIRYVKRPRPIILTDLSDTFGEDLTINGYNKAMTCELNESTHEAILQRAVELAKVAWAGNLNEAQLEIEAGKRSE